jgi:hypothetical protein
VVIPSSFLQRYFQCRRDVISDFALAGTGTPSD